MTLQLELDGPLLARVQGEPVKVPAPSLLNVTVPVGTVRVPVSESLTVAVQVVAPPTASAAGAQDTVVEVLRLVTVRLKLEVVALEAWVESPPYVALMEWVPLSTAVGV